MLLSAILALLPGTTLPCLLPGELDPVREGSALISAEAPEESPIQAALDAADAALAAIVAVPAKERTVANTLLAIDDAQAQFMEDARMLAFMADVSPDAEERATGRTAQTDMNSWFNRLAQNEGLFRAVQELGELDPKMTAEERRYFEDSLRDFRRAGFDLSPEGRARLAEIDEELNELGADFRQNIADDATVVFFTKEELHGVPESFVGTLKRSGDLYHAHMKGPSLGYILGYCDVETTRAKMGAAASMRGGAANVRVLEKLIQLRHERATLLGYPSTAAYILETKMAKSPETVMAFFEDLRPKLRKKAAADFAEFEAAKRKHTGDPEAQLTATDVAFYTTWLKREKYAVDTAKLREYLSMADVTAGMFGVYQDLFGITFNDITEKSKASRPFWHDDVRLYEVIDNASGDMLGEFYLDLFPREGKYSHAAQFPIHLRKRWADGRLTTPLVALVCNFTKPTDDQPSLMSHREVQTFFHEFGHCLHSILTEVGIANLSGTQVARDFVEAPSQMLENWVWTPEILSRFARHYETGEPLPMEIIDGMIAAKNLGAGFNNEGQIYLGMMDMRFHMDDDGIVDTTAVCEETYSEARMFEATPNFYRQASFGHLVGYHAGYYGYLWSLVYAQDMWSRFEDEPMNPEVAMEYRKRVLAPGGTRDALDLVRDFLGREPSGDAFLKHLGLDAAEGE